MQVVALGGAQALSPRNPRGTPDACCASDRESRHADPSAHRTYGRHAASAVGQTAHRVLRCGGSGLSLRITSDGAKTWTLLYRHHGRKRRLTLGRFPDLGLGKARLRATEERGRVAGGADPATEKRDERATYGDTVGALFELYKKATEKKRSWLEQRRIFENEVLPAWRYRRVQDIARRDIRILVDRKAETAPITANRIPARVSRLFSFAVGRDWIEANPALRIGKPADEKSRDRVLSTESGQP